MRAQKDGLTRRAAMAGVAAAAVGGVVAVSPAGKSAEQGPGAAVRQPAIFVPHGGGPWPFVDLGGFISPEELAQLRGYFERLPQLLPAEPRALLVISAHWEAPVPTVMTSPRPPILYDYYGFPPESYEIQWPAPGSPELAQRVVERLGRAGIATRADAGRGFDHGTFIPFKVSWPKAEIPTIQLSLKAGLDPSEHLAIGRALEPLRDEGVLLLGSGMSYHNLRAFGTGPARRVAERFDAWLQAAATAEPEARARKLIEWASAPSAREAHPREEHLLPLMVMAGASGADLGRVTFSEVWAGVRVSAVQFG